MKKLVPLLIFIILAIRIAAQSPGEKLQKHQGQYPVEKVYISHDLPFYAPGDTIWCEAFLVDGREHRIFDGEPILYVDWYNTENECARSFTLKIKEGTAAFEIPTSLRDSLGTHYIRAYTQYQKNFDSTYHFQKPILLTIGDAPPQELAKSQDFSIQFFPEGGYAIENLNNKIAIKALNQDGDPIAVEGILRNKAGETLQAVKAVHEGIGVFGLNPQPGDRYQLVANYQGKEKIFDLPDPLPKGYMLSVNNRSADYIELTIMASAGTSLNGTDIVGHLRGQVFFQQTINKDNGYKVRLPKNKIPSGIIHLTLFDAQDRPVAERLCYNANLAEKVDINTLTDKEVYTNKEPIQLDVRAARSVGDLSGKYTVSVYNGSLVKDQELGMTIQNYLLLQSDLKGHISNIDQYFKDESTKSRVLLDYVMMTHAWRRFDWQEVLRDQLPSILYPPEQTISFAGRVTKKGSKNPVKADVFLNVLSQEQFSSTNLTTEDDGLFYFKGYQFMDTTELVILANIYNAKKKGKQKGGEAKRSGNKNVEIELLKLHEQSFAPQPGYIPTFEEMSMAYAKAVEDKRTVDAAYSGLIKADINEVTVEANRLSLRQERINNLKAEYRKRGLVFSPSSKKVFLDDLPNKGQNFQDFYELIGSMVPGVQVDRSQIGNKRLFLSNVNVRITTDVQPAILVIDGMTINTALGGVPPPLVPLDIQTVDVISPIQASQIYGEQAIGGAIVILTREEAVAIGDQSLVNRKGTLNITHPGFYAARTFYTPDYSKPLGPNPKPDLRNTLYWNPEVQLSDSGQKLKFYAGDQSGIFKIKIEGLTKDGVPFVHWDTFEVQAQ